MRPEFVRVFRSWVEDNEGSERETLENSGLNRTTDEEIPEVTQPSARPSEPKEKRTVLSFPATGVNNKRQLKLSFIVARQLSKYK